MRQVLMEAALSLTRGVPRAYLLPSPQQRRPDAQLTFQPHITQKSKVRRPHFAYRWVDWDCHETPHHTEVEGDRPPLCLPFCCLGLS